MNIIQKFDQHEVRFVSHPEGTFDFGVVADDLAIILKASSGKDIARAVDKDWKGLHIMSTSGGTRTVTVLWSPGIYELLAKSRKARSKEFFKWLISRTKLDKTSFVTGTQQDWQQDDAVGFIYLAKATQTRWCKIGMSKQPYKRMTSLQTGSPLEITLIHRIFTFDMSALEKALHEYYSAYWLRGEWFDLPSECVQEFPTIANELDMKVEQVCLPK